MQDEMPVYEAESEGNAQESGYSPKSAAYFSLPGVRKFVLDKNPRPAIYAHGSDLALTLEFGEMRGTIFYSRHIRLRKINIQGSDIETALRSEAEAITGRPDGMALIVQEYTIENGEIVPVNRMFEPGRQAD